VNGLAQTLLKLTSPGVPDIYQGTEFWDLSLVDPDNRRPVDFATRMKAIAGQRPLHELASRWRDGRLKQTVIRRALAVRRRAPRLFSEGDYVPIATRGCAGKHVIAFARRAGNAVALAIVIRLPAALFADADSLVIPPRAWGDTSLVLPQDLSRLTFCDAISGFRLQASAGIFLRDALRRLPIALLMAGASANA
jgi:(1->4)-alpha-D-glucan 1-alpha-D-glucosylmutase